MLFSPRETPVGKAVTTPSFTVTLRPGRARCTPLMTTRSCGSSPSAITRKPSIEPAGAYDLLAHDAFGVDDVNDLARLVRDDGLVRHEQRVERLQREQPQLAEHAGER